MALLVAVRLGNSSTTASRASREEGQLLSLNHGAEAEVKGLYGQVLCPSGDYCAYSLRTKRQEFSSNTHPIDHYIVMSFQGGTLS